MLTRLPDISTLKRLCQSLAMLDAILMPEWDGRDYSFNAHWAPGQMMASRRNGEGDDLFLLFTSAGVILKGYAHESERAAFNIQHGHPAPGVIDAVPPEFQDFVAEPAFSPSEATFCFWRCQDDSTWQCAAPCDPVEDGSDDLLAIYDGQPKTYRDWAQEYYERRITLYAIEAVYRHEPLTEALVKKLRRGASLADLSEDITEIAYPLTNVIE